MLTFIPNDGKILMKNKYVLEMYSSFFEILVFN